MYLYDKGTAEVINNSYNFIIGLVAKYYSIPVYGVRVFY